MKFLTIAASVAALALSGAGAAQAAVSIVNGSFEAGLAGSIGNFATLSAGDTTSITGWEVGDAGVDLIESYWNAQDGRRSLDLSALNAGSVSQDLVGLSIGQRYLVSFFYAGNPDGGNGIKVGATSVNGGQSTVFNFVQSGTHSNMNWTPGVYEFTANAATMKLAFASNENNPFGPALDNVSISAAVPEPATWAMMILGFGGMGTLLRRRRALVLA